MSDQVSIQVTDSSLVGEVRRAATAKADGLSFTEAVSGAVAIVATELATNLLRHAGTGEILIRGIRETGRPPALEMLSLDQGPGMADVDRAMRDGYSTVGGQGTGLGAVARLSHLFDISTAQGAGTAILSRFWASGHPVDWRDGLVWSSILVPATGESICGDSCAVLSNGEGGIFLVADGLGHGLLAADASRQAATLLSAQEPHGFDSSSFFDRAHRAMIKTRGAAMAVAEIDAERGEVRYTGVGNIAARVYDEQGRTGERMVSHNGIVGHEMRKVHRFRYRWPHQGLLIMHSDGLGSSWGLEDYPGLARRHPSLIAGVLYRDHKRGRDDVSVLVAREYTS